MIKQSHPFTSEELFEKARYASRVTARKFSAVEEDDLTQEVFIAAWKQMTEKKHPEDWDRWLNAVSFNQATTLHERIMHCKFVQYEYTPAVVRKILEVAFSYGDWDSAEIPVSAKSPPRGTHPVYDQDLQGDITQGVPDPTDSRDMCLDVQICLDLLTPEDRLRIITRYKYGEIPGRNSSEMKALYRAVDRLTQKLNGYRGETRKASTTGRKARSNAASNAIIHRAWGG